MNSYPHLKRWSAAFVSAAVFVGVVLFGISNQSTGNAQKNQDGKSDWPMYGGTLSRNMVNDQVKNIPAEWDTDTNENIIWAADLGSRSYGGPVIADGKVYVGTNNQRPRNPKDVDEKGNPIDLGVIMCFDEKTGKFLWQNTFEKLKAGLVHDWPLEGICSSPMVRGDKLYYVSNRCEVVCANTDGKIQWKYDMMGKLGVFPHNLAVCSPLLVEDDLWVVTANGVDEAHLNVPKPAAPSFIRMDVSKNPAIVSWQDNHPSKYMLTAKKEKDQKAFFKTLVNRGKLLQHGQWSNPSYAVVNGQQQVIFPGGDGWIYSFNRKSGQLIWKFDCNPKDAVYELSGRGTRNDFIATPVIYKDRVYIGVGQDPEHEYGVGHFYCIDMTKKGDVSPTLVTDDSVFPPKTKPNPNSAQVWHFGGKGNPEYARRNYKFGRTMSTAAIKDGLVYVSELAGYLHCLDADTGKHYWAHNLNGDTWSSPFWADGKVFMGTDAGDLLVFKHGKKKELLTTNFFDGRVRAAPVAANDTLYVMTENKLYAIGQKKN